MILMKKNKKTWFWRRWCFFYGWAMSNRSKSVDQNPTKKNGFKQLLSWRVHGKLVCHSLAIFMETLGNTQRGQKVFEVSRENERFDQHQSGDMIFLATNDWCVLHFFQINYRFWSMNTRASPIYHVFLTKWWGLSGYPQILRPGDHKICCHSASSAYHVHKEVLNMKITCSSMINFLI